MLFLSLCIFSVARATSSDEEILINKFEKVYLSLAPNDPARDGVILRMADLYAESARRKSLQDSSLEVGKREREKALQYYLEVLKKDPSQVRVTTQVGHLYELLGDSVQAEKFYLKAGAVNTEAQFSLAELKFRQGQYLQALPYYQQVFENKNSWQRGLSAYRISWIHFNSGRMVEAIENTKMILKTSALLSRSSADVGVEDSQFKEEVSRDLATFMSKLNVTEVECQLLYELSPDKARVSNAIYLASELERLGNYLSAMKVWKWIYPYQTQAESRLETHAHLAALHLKNSQNQLAQEEFFSALHLWVSVGDCANCLEIKTRLKNFVIDWNKDEKKKPSAELLIAYQKYLQVFPADLEMKLLAAQAAQASPNYAQAIDWFLDYAVNINDSEKTEKALQMAIASAELSQDQGHMKRVYESYIQNSALKKQISEVQYQKANLLYRSNQYELASRDFYQLAKNENAPAKIREMSADLALDCLVLLKQEPKIEEWANELALIFPSSQFHTLAAQSILNQVKAESDPAQAWETLNRFPKAKVSRELKQSFLFNQLILAEKLQKLTFAKAAADELLVDPELKEKDFVLSRKAWLAELQLDFEAALAASSQIKIKPEQREAHLLKLIMYAELAKKDVTPYYLEFIKTSKDGQQKSVIAAQLVRASKEPLKEIGKYSQDLMANSKVFSSLCIDLYQQKPSDDLVNALLKQNGVMGTLAGEVLLSHRWVHNYLVLNSILANHKIESQTTKQMTATIKKRAQLLGQSEVFLKNTAESGSWLGQVLALHLVSLQSQKFYQEVIALPLPEGLSEADQAEYLQALSAQAGPFQLRAQEAASKLSEFWQSSPDFLKEKPFHQWYSVIQSIAPEAKKSQFAPTERTLASAAQPTLQELEVARSEVRAHPLNREKLSQLLEIEKSFGPSPMVSYLNQRLMEVSQ